MLWTAISASFRGCSSGYRSIAVEVRLVIGEISAAFNGQRRSMSRLAAAALASAVFRWKLAATHLGALLFENGLARQPDAIAFDRQHFHQNLIAFLQLVANIFNAMFRDFADVQQTIGAGDDLDKRAEVSQPRDSAEIGLSDLSRGGQVCR